jgi:serine/arginine repetitive matrix protein 2
MSYNGIGLQTTRGSGTNGYVQGNKFHRSASRLQRQEWRDLKSIHGAGAGASKKPDEAILEHNRKREIEAKLMQLEDDLEEKGVGAEEIARGGSRAVRARGGEGEEQGWKVRRRRRRRRRPRDLRRARFFPPPPTARASRPR